MQPDDDLATIQARVEEAVVGRVLLVVPQGCRVLRQLVNLKLLARHARRSGKGLALLTSDGTVHTLAREAGLSTFTWRAMALRLPWRAPGDVGRRLAIEDLARAVPRPPRPQPRRPRRGYPLLALPVLLTLMAVGAAVVALVVPKATITLTPSTQAVTHTFEVLADPEIEDVDVQSRLVPARRLTVTFIGTAEAGTMKQKDAPDAQATGFVTLRNRRSEPTIIPQGTIVSTSTGVAIRFQTEEEVTIPPLGSVRVPIKALDPGPSGNVDALAINSVEPRYAYLVNVVNDAPTSGGTVKRVGVVSLEDKERLHKMLLTRLAQEAAGHMESKLEPGEFLVPQSVSIAVIGETFGEAVDVLSEVLSLQMQVRGYGLAVAVEDVGKVAAEALEEQVPQGFELLPESLAFQPHPGLSSQDAAAEGGRYPVEVRVWGTAVAQIDRERVIAAVRGLSIEEAVRELTQKMRLATPPEVVVEQPDWLEQVPWLEDRLPWLGLRVQVVASE